jgi:hypothetical protein
LLKFHGKEELKGADKTRRKELESRTVEVIVITCKL